MLTLLLLGAIGRGQDVSERVKELIERLGSDSVAEREEATRRLYELGPEALPALEEAAARADPEIAGRAKDMLAVFPRKAFPKLYALLSDDRRPLEPEALRSFTVRDLRRFLCDADPTVRGRAAAALGRLGDRNAASDLLDLHADPHHFVRVHAAGALRDLEAMDALKQFLARVWKTP
jgi:HEAT repeat protein